MTPRPFTLQGRRRRRSADLRARLERVRWPDEAPGARLAATAPSLAYMKELVAYWRDRYDWRAHEARAQRAAAVHGAGRRHRPPLHPRSRASGPTPLPLLLSHGWPGSIVEFHEIIPLLTDPARFGGDPADAFTVVAPSLPGLRLLLPAEPAALRRRGHRRRSSPR